MLIFLSLFYWTDVKTFFSVCPDTQYISNRKCVPCQGHCKGGEPCNKLTGRCDNGCQNYWTGDLCQSVYHSFKPNMLFISFKVLCMGFLIFFYFFQLLLLWLGFQTNVSIRFFFEYFLLNIPTMKKSLIQIYGVVTYWKENYMLKSVCFSILIFSMRYGKLPQ